MRRILNSIVILTLLLVFHSAYSGLPDTIDRVKTSVVGIGTYQATRQIPLEFRATGFIVTDGNHVVTNYHVIKMQLDFAKDEHLVVVIGRGSKGRWFRLHQVALDKEHDLALLSFNGPVLPALTVDTHKSVREGQAYVFTGYPIAPVLGLFPVTHRAMISAITPMITPKNDSNELTASQIVQLRKTKFNVYQLDATAYPGNSGSPLYDPHTGNVIAIINSVLVKKYRENALIKPSGISYAIPSRYLWELLQRVDRK